MQIVIEMADDISLTDFIDFQSKLGHVCESNKHLIKDRSLNFMNKQEMKKYMCEQ